MKKLVLASAVAVSLSTVASTAAAEDISLGVFLGLTGPIESLVANMAPAAEHQTKLLVLWVAIALV